MLQNNENCTISLEIFEGPLDLLIYLIRKDDLDIYDIPISGILEQYQNYLGVLEELDIDVAGEFILMASELAHIKSKMLLFGKNEEEEEDDPRADLIARLVEYQRYKFASGWLLQRNILGRDVFKRQPVQEPAVIEEEPVQEPAVIEEEELSIEPFALISKFSEILKKAPRHQVHEIEMERISVTERIYQIVETLKNNADIDFEFLFQEKTRSEMVVTFLAILEMAKLKMIRIFQVEHFGTIRLSRSMQVGDMEEMQIPKDTIIQ